MKCLAFSHFIAVWQEADLLSGKGIRTCFLRGGPALGCASTIPLLRPRIENSSVFASNGPWGWGWGQVHTDHVGSVPANP